MTITAEPAARTVQHHYRPILFTCPRRTCQAPPGAGCVSDTGQGTASFHAARRALAESATEQQIADLTTALYAARDQARAMVTDLKTAARVAVAAADWTRGYATMRRDLTAGWRLLKRMLLRLSRNSIARRAAWCGVLLHRRSSHRLPR